MVNLSGAEYGPLSHEPIAVRIDATYPRAAPDPPDWTELLAATIEQACVLGFDVILFARDAGVRVVFRPEPL